MQLLRDIEFTLAGFPINAYQLALIGLTVALLYLIGFLLNNRLFRWFYRLDTTSSQNSQRTRQVVRFVLGSILVIATLRILNIDFELYDGAVQNATTDDGPPVYFSVYISTLVKALAAFVSANVVDLVLEEFFVQLYYRKTNEDGTPAARKGDIARSFSALRPLLYTVAALYVASDTGISNYSFYDFLNPQQEVVSQITLANVLQAFATLFAIRLLVNVATGFIMQGYYNRRNVDVGSQFAINRLLTYFVYLIGVLLVIQAMGFDLVVIWTGAAALLVGIGIGLQQTFNDLICGVIILFERSVKVGDVVELSGEHQVGTVRKIGARTSVLETRDDIIIFVPNSKLIGENVTNWSQVKRIARFHVHVGVAYGSDTELVKSTLLDVASSHPRVLQSPASNVRFLDFGDSSLNFDLLFWSRDFLRIEDVKSDIRFAIDQAFRRQKIEIPFPQRDVHIRSSVVPLPDVIGEEE